MSAPKIINGHLLLPRENGWWTLSKTYCTGTAQIQGDESSVFLIARGGEPGPWRMVETPCSICGSTGLLGDGCLCECIWSLSCGVCGDRVGEDRFETEPLEPAVERMGRNPLIAHIGCMTEESIR